MQLTEGKHLAMVVFCCSVHELGAHRYREYLVCWLLALENLKSSQRARVGGVSVRNYACEYQFLRVVRFKTETAAARKQGDQEYQRPASEGRHVVQLQRSARLSDRFGAGIR